MLSFSNVSSSRYHQPHTVYGGDSPKILAILAATLSFEFWILSRFYAQDMGNLKFPSVVVFGGISGMTRKGRSGFLHNMYQWLCRPGFHYWRILSGGQPWKLSGSSINAACWNSLTCLLPKLSTTPETLSCNHPDFSLRSWSLPLFAI